MTQALDVAALERLKADRPKLWRKLVKAARKAEGRVPARSQKGDERRAIKAAERAVGASFTKRQKANATRLYRAMQADSLTSEQDEAA